MSLCIIQFSSVEGIKHPANLDDEQSKEERQIELEAGIDTNSYVQNQLDEYFRSHVARRFMNTLRKINTVAAPLLWLVSVIVAIEFAFSAHWTRNLPISGDEYGYLWLAITCLWVWGIVDAIRFSINWREVKLRWFIPTCLFNLLGLTLVFLYLVQVVFK